MSFDLNDLRYFLAVAQAGSLSGAARALSVAQPTVGRRIKALELALDARLFERLPHGYALSPAGAGILDAVRRIEEDALLIERQIGGEMSVLSGSVRLAVSEGLGNYWLAPKISDFCAEYPRIEIELLVGTTLSDLLRREADVALRVGLPGSEELVGRCLGQIYCGLYADKSYLAAHGEPASLDDLPKHRVIDSVGDIASLAQVRQFKAVISKAAVAMTSNSLVTQLQAVNAGMGIAPLPSYMATGHPELVRVLPREFETRLDLWLVTHRQLRETARIRALRDFLQRTVESDSRLLANAEARQDDGG